MFKNSHSEWRVENSIVERKEERFDQFFNNVLQCLWGKGNEIYI